MNTSEVIDIYSHTFDIDIIKLRNFTFVNADSKIKYLFLRKCIIAKLKAFELLFKKVLRVTPGSLHPVRSIVLNLLAILDRI